MWRQAEGSWVIPHKQVPFYATACPESSAPPSREKPILFQCPADGTSHQKAFHSFHHVIYCFVPLVEEETALPNIFNFQSQTSLYKGLLSPLGLCMLYVWHHEPWLNTSGAISNNYGTAWHRTFYCFNYSPDPALDKHLGSAAIQRQKVQDFRSPPCVTQHLSYSSDLNYWGHLGRRESVPLKGSSCCNG